MRYGAGLAMAALLALGAPGAALASDADVIRDTQARADIETLMWTYVRAIDSFNEEAYVAVFTPDGAFLNAKGSDALRKLVVDLKKSRADRAAKGEKMMPMHHIMSNQHIEIIDADHARVHYYWMTVFGAGAGVKPKPDVAAVGRGVDDVVRVNGKWLIKNRNVSPTD